MVHRDIKPANLMLSRRGNRATVKILDFGLAKATLQEKADSGLTSEGQALGTPDYIAPEQILDAPGADIRADIYSLGGTLYYLLTGRPPFEAGSLYDIYQAHISRLAFTPLNLVRPEVPAELAAVVAKMMAKDPARRFQTPSQVAKALRPFWKIGAPVPRPEHPDATEPGSISPPTQPATVAATSAPETLPEERWPSLIAVSEAESLVAKAGSDVKWPGGGSRRRWLAALCLIGIVAWGVTLSIKTEDGVVVMEGLPEQAEVPRGRSNHCRQMAGRSHKVFGARRARARRSKSDRF